MQEHGDWLTREEQMARRGYLLHNGRYVTQQQLDLQEKSEAQRAAELEWFSFVHVRLRLLTGRNSRQQLQAETELREIADPAAVPALVQHLGGHALLEVRRLYVSVLAGIGGPRVVGPLVERALLDPNDLLRTEALSSIKPAQYGTAVALLVRGLSNNDNIIVNRAGTALRRDWRCVGDSGVDRSGWLLRTPT
ncbi:MAG: HEAT repeat domain-containing protein [Planctomycetaceae bacterium]